jgi:2-oxo-4-hydroxy-4-carboxy-5-ureidoimidazoline decarboxylase
MTNTPNAQQAFPLTDGSVVADTKSDFLQAYAKIFEHSAWVVERAWSLRPFADAEVLYAAFRRVLRELSPDESLQLIRAHPQLADRVAIAAGLTESSVAEQASAGLDRLTAQEFERFQTLNDAYRNQHGFPFIICARLYGKEQILSIMQQRLLRTTGEEVTEAIDQISQICRLRLWTQLSG